MCFSPIEVPIAEFVDDQQIGPGVEAPALVEPTFGGIATQTGQQIGGGDEVSGVAARDRGDG